MKEVKVMPRYKCDFCKKRSTKQFMLKHEPTCYRNPKRICYLCNNSKEVSAGDDNCTPVPCPECERFDPEKLKAIEDYEKALTLNNHE